MKKILVVVFVLMVASALIAQVPPQNLTATVSGNNVTLNWDAPETEVIFTLAGPNFQGGIGTGTNGPTGMTSQVAARFSPARIAEFGIAGMVVDQIHFWVMQNPSSASPHSATVTVKIWTSAPNSNSPTQQYAGTAITYPPPQGAATYTDQVDVTNPWLISATQDLWIGYHVTTTSASWPLGHDGGTNTNYSENMCEWNGSWTTLNGLVSSLQANWQIRARAIDPGTGQVVEFGTSSKGEFYTTPIETPIVLNTSSLFEHRAIDPNFLPAITQPNRNGSRAVTGYTVNFGPEGTTFANSTQLAANHSTTTYTHTNTSGTGVYVYYVRAIHNETNYSAPVAVNAILGDPVVEVTDTWTESFEGALFPPSGWRSINLGTGIAANFPWVRQNLGTGAHQGSYVATSPSYDNTAGAMTPNNWLITPKLLLGVPSDPGYSWSVVFYVAAMDGSYPQDRLSLYYTTGDATNTAGYTQIWTHIIQNDQWLEVIINLEDIAGLDPYTAPFNLAFRHHDCYDWFWAMLDDVRIEQISNLDTQFLPPNNFSGAVDGTQITLVWDPPTTITQNFRGYNIYRNDRMAHQITGNTLSWMDNRTFNGLFVYKIAARYESPTGESVHSEPVALEVVDGFEFVNPPKNLRYETSTTTNETTVMWDEPTVDLLTLQYGGDTWEGSLRWNSGASWTSAIRFTPTMLEEAGVVGKYLGYVGVFARDPEINLYTMKVWIGGTGPATTTGTTPQLNPGTLVREIPLIGGENLAWNMIELDDLLLIPEGQELWIGYTTQNTETYAAVYSAEQCVNNFGNLMTNPGWMTLFSLSADYPYNWMIRGGVYDFDIPSNIITLDGSLISSTLNSPINSRNDHTISSSPAIPNITNPTVYIPAFTRPQSRALTGYNVYYKQGLDGTEVLLTDPPIYETEYNLGVLPTDYHFVDVSAVYTGNIESDRTEILFYNGLIELSYADFPYTQGFELPAQPAVGWQLFRESASTSPGWRRFSGDGIGYNNSFGVVLSESKDIVTGAGYTPRNWLISPRVHLPNTDVITLSWYVRAFVNNASGDQYRLMITTAHPLPANPASSFTLHPACVMPVYFNTGGSTQWQYMEVSLAQWAGQSIYFAFVHRGTDNNDAVVLDDITITSSVSENDGTEKPLVTALKANYPNPFNPTTTISYSVANDSDVAIEVFNIKGQKVTTLVNDFHKAGNHQVIWNGKDTIGNDVASGIYFYRMKAGEYTSTSKMILMK